MTKYKKRCENCGWESREYTQSERNTFIGVGGLLSCPNCRVSGGKRLMGVYGSVKVIVVNE